MDERPKGYGAMKDDPTAQALAEATNVLPFKPEVVGEGYRFDPDAILEAAKAQGFSRLVIVADYTDKPGIWISGSANAGESLMLLEAAKLSLIKPMIDD